MSSHSPTTRALPAAGVYSPGIATHPDEGAVLRRKLTAALSLLNGARAVVLTGAGISTTAGIPDYRGPQSITRRPMSLADFLAGEQQRRRYWARNHLGWRIVDRATPTPAHRDLAALEAAGAVGGIITQNIDLLHLKAGSHRLVDIHGNYATIRCYHCGDRRLRHELADELESINPQLADYLLHIQVEAAPDADAEVPDHLIEGFRMVPCRRCGGFYKPDIVYFGEQVPRPRRLLAEQLVDQADALVVLGSSLSVYSGKRFVKRAARAGTPIIIANRGHTGGDQYATVRVDVDVNLFTAAWREAYRANR